MSISRRTLLLTGAGGLITAASTSIPTRAAAPVLGRGGASLTWNGARVRLAGVATSDPLDGRAGRPGTDMGVIADSWRANVVRLPVGSASWRDRRSALLASLDRDVTAALAAGMWVIVDWHVVGWPDGQGESAWDDTDWNLCLDFWSAMRDRYGEEGRIAFELWNEPLSPTAWGESGATTWPELRARYAQLVQLIRSTSGNLILCAGDWNGYDCRGIRENPVPGANIGYVWHCYPVDGKGDPASWATLLDALPATAPVVVTEWGFDPVDTSQHYYGSAVSFGDRLLPFLDARGMHWTAWCWSPDWGPAMLKSDWRSPTTFGAYVKYRLALGTPSRPV